MKNGGPAPPATLPGRIYLHIRIRLKRAPLLDNTIFQASNIVYLQSQRKNAHDALLCLYAAVHGPGDVAGCSVDLHDCVKYVELAVKKPRDSPFVLTC